MIIEKCKADFFLKRFSFKHLEYVEKGKQDTFIGGGEQILYLLKVLNTAHSPLSP